METALKSIPNLSFHQRIRNNDQVDQLHNYVTVYLLVLAGLAVGFRELAGEPLDCWATLQKWKHFQSHVNSYCWAGGLYHYPNAKNLSQMPFSLEGDHDNPEAGSVERLNVYKWVTIIFLLQAVFFKLPDVLWRECNAHSGTKLEQVVAMVKEATLKEATARRTDLNTVAQFFETWLKLNGRREDLTTDDEFDLAWCFEYNKKNRFLSTTYLLVKLGYLMNVIHQFVLLTLFLEFDFWHYGRHVTLPGARPEVYFPSTGLCPFRVKGQSEWVQCFLNMNMMMEKIFLVEWFWFLILLVVTLVNIMTWIPRIFRQHTGLSFIRRYLRVFSKEADNMKRGKGTVRHFVCHYLGQDGVFILRMLAINTSSVAMAEFSHCLWNRYADDQDNAKKRRRMSTVPPPTVKQLNEPEEKPQPPTVASLTKDDNIEMHIFIDKDDGRQEVDTEPLETTAMNG